VYQPSPLAEDESCISTGQNRSRPIPALELVKDNVIVKGKGHKMQILQEYEAEFVDDYPQSIITKRKGKHSHEPDIVIPTRMLPSIKKYYRVKEL